MIRPSLSLHHVSHGLSRSVCLPIGWLRSRGRGGAGSRGSGGSRGGQARLGRGRRGRGGYLLDAGAGHVTGRAPDGRRPFSARPERPARPLPWGAATAARTRTRTRCGRRGRGSGVRAEILGHGAQRKVGRRGSAGLQGSLSTGARRGHITEETPGRAATPFKASVLFAQPLCWDVQAAAYPARARAFHLSLPSDLYNFKDPQPRSRGSTFLPASFSVFCICGLCESIVKVGKLRL